MSEMVRDIVHGLENRFTGINELLSTTASLGTTWKDDALQTTLRELPKISLTGTESGPFRGFGSSIYTSSREENDRRQEVDPKLLDSRGRWKTDLDLRVTLKELNPPLKRSYILNCNSGQYSSSLMVNAKLATATNPTGMVVKPGLPIRRDSWRNMKRQIEQSRAVASGNLIVLLLVRSHDAICYDIEVVVDEANELLEGTEERKKYDIVRVDVGDDTSILRELDVRSLPMFVIYQSGQLAYSGQIGGKHLPNAPGKPSVLIIERNYKQQMVIEKAVQGLRFDSFLCLSIKEALDHAIHVFSLTPDIVLIDDDLRDEEAYLTALISRLSSTGRDGRRSLIVGVAQKSIRLRSKKIVFSSGEEKIVLSDALGKHVNVAIARPIKAASIQALYDMTSNPLDRGEAIGLTKDAFIQKLREVYNSSPLTKLPHELRPGRILSALGTVGIRTTAEDIRVRGTPLIK